MSDVDIIEWVLDNCDYPEEDDDGMTLEEREYYDKEYERYCKMTDEEKDNYWKERFEEEMKAWDAINF